MTTRGAGTNRAAMLRVSIPGNWRARSRADMLRWASIGALMAIWIGLVSWVLPVGASSGPTIPTEGSTAAMLRELGGLPIAPSHLSQAVLDEAWAKAERTRAEIDAARGLVRHEGGEEAYPYLIAGFSTRLRLGEDGRNHNIQVAARRLDGLVVPPGAVISFNEIVGIRTVDAGFAPALVLFEGQGVMGIGGGICQVSTTLFNTALLAGFSVHERHQHSRAVSYIELGRDAAVADAGLDLVLQNTSGQELLLRARADDRRISIALYGQHAPETQYTLEARQVSEVPVSLAGPGGIQPAPDPSAAKRFGPGVRVELHRIATNGRSEMIARSNYPAGR